jgi:GT2 family glycosyltransferase/glycosyltransferase involved in cell wall biosynthesis
MKRTRPVDIVVPLFNARADVMRCVRSVLRHASQDSCLILVDDCSSDTELVSFLEDVAANNSTVELLRPEQNGGFVQSANMGMRRSLEKSEAGNQPRDILLLNSDTIVTPQFLERIQACAYTDNTTGIVSPFSNNATICSIPKFCCDNPLPENISIDDYAEAISRCSLQQRPELVTAVGFCMYIRKEVIDAVGLFDSIYGRGFGEENDLCEAAKKAGFKIRLADDVFVAHTGKASFGAEGSMLESQNMQVLLSRYPRYLEDVTAFCEANPLAEVQRRADYFGRRAVVTDFPACLHLLHSDPFQASAGGSEHYALDLIRAQALQRTVLMYPSPGGFSIAEVHHGDVTQPLHHFYPLSPMPEKICYQDDATAALVNTLLDAFHISQAHIHHLFFWPVGIWKVFGNRGIPYVVMLHDYYAVCPSHNLFDYATMHCCGCNLDQAECAACLPAYAATAQTALPGTTADTVREHRACFAGLLQHATAVIAPSQRALSLVGERSPVEFCGRVIPHGYRQDEPTEAFQPVTHGVLKVAVLGNINYPNKGAENYLEVVRLTREREIEWHFFGDIAAFGYQQRLQAAGVPERLAFHGAYTRAEIISLLHRQEIQLAVMLPACHETFSFTLSEALLAGIPVLALNTGSLEERLTDAGLGECLCKTPANVVERLLYFLAYRSELSKLQEQVRSYRHSTWQECADRILDAYGPSAAALQQRSTEIPEAAQRETFAAHLRAFPPADQEQSPLVSVEELRPEWWSAASRHLGRAAGIVEQYFKGFFLRQKIRVVEYFAFRQLARQCSLSADTQLLQIGARSAAFRAHGRDPYLVFPQKRILTGEVDCLRLRIRCDTQRQPKAQLFWTHEQGEAFSEAKSLRIPLQQTSGWQDILLDFRRWTARRSWQTGPAVVALRLDPLDCEGYFELQDLTFAKFAA